MTATVSGLMTWAVARRYGARRAVVVPFLALAAVGLLVWRAARLSSLDAMWITAVAVGLVGPSVAGALLALMLVRRRDR